MLHGNQRVKSCYDDYVKLICDEMDGAAADFMWLHKPFLWMKPNSDGLNHENDFVIDFSSADYREKLGMLENGTFVEEEEMF